jgi:CheY-like chemotaxis protein
MDGATTARALETIERNAHSQRQLIDDILDVSRIITGKLKIDYQQVDLSPVVAATVETVRPALESKAIGLSAELQSSACCVAGDANRLQQVVWNLFSNAIKFTPESGSVSVRLNSDDSHAELTVSDTGCGIRPEFLPHIFDRFRQADGTTTRKHGGLGLGLAIVRHLVELHGGTITADSAGENAGATFTVRLPLAPSARGQSEQDTRRNARRDGHARLEDPRALDGVRVLVVDDERDTRELIKAILVRCGAEPKTCESVSEALEALRSWRADVILSDIGMPGEDGYSLMKRLIGGDSGGEPIPVVALTAYAGTEDRTRALDAGFRVHLAKPIEPGELVAVISNLVGKKK